jgi:hypothetical protein
LNPEPETSADIAQTAQNLAEPMQILAESDTYDGPETAPSHQGSQNHNTNTTKDCEFRHQKCAGGVHESQPTKGELPPGLTLVVES